MYVRNGSYEIYSGESSHDGLLTFAQFPVIVSVLVFQFYDRSGVCSLSVQFSPIGFSKINTLVQNSIVYCQNSHC